MDFILKYLILFLILQQGATIHRFYDDVTIIDSPDFIKASHRSTRQKRQILYPFHMAPPYQMAPLCRDTNGDVGSCSRASQCPLFRHVNNFQDLINVIDFSTDILGVCPLNLHYSPQSFVCCAHKHYQGPPQYPPYGYSLEEDEERDADCMGKVVGGTTGVPNAYPWMAALVLRGHQGCGGSLIDDRHILTAAHCVVKMTTDDISNLRIYLGAHDVTAPSEPYRQVYKPSRVFYYSQFSLQTFYDDIAIIRLSTRVPEFSEKIRPICLSDGQPPYDTPGSKANLTGWGKLGSNLAQSPKLQQVEVSVWTNGQCHAKYGRRSPAGITNGMVCAGIRGKDACNGDSGGPLMRMHPTDILKTEQIGIVSFGIGCGEYPGVYTRVDMYRDWISKVKKISDYARPHYY